MEIIAIGLNHKTAPVELRERLAFSETKLIEAYSVLRRSSFVRESLILSTCNRVEIYGVVDDLEKGLQRLKESLSACHEIDLADFEPGLYTYSGTDSVGHLFNVASGLDSMVIGETQILGQLKQAYFKAHRNNALGRVLEPLLQRAFRAARKVRNSTNISKGAVSVSSVAVNLVEEIGGDLSKALVIVIGAGKMSELAVQHLVSKGVSSILVSNRAYEKAQSLAERIQGAAIKFDRLREFMGKVDILISSTSAPHFVIRKKDLWGVMEKRKGRPLFLIDLAVPRDIEPEVKEIAGVYLYNIDDLKIIAQKNLRLRQEEADIASRIVRISAEKFMKEKRGHTYFSHQQQLV